MQHTEEKILAIADQINHILEQNELSILEAVGLLDTVKFDILNNSIMDEETP